MAKPFPTGRRLPERHRLEPLSDQINREREESPTRFPVGADFLRPIPGCQAREEAFQNTRSLSPALFPGSSLVSNQEAHFARRNRLNAAVNLATVLASSTCSISMPNVSEPSRKTRHRLTGLRFLPCCGHLSLAKTHGWTGHGENCPQIHAPFKIAALVRQSRQPRHDRALSGALSQLRPHPGGVAVRQADHRHRADRFGPVALQPAPSRAREARARGNPRSRRHRLRVSVSSDPGDRQASNRRARPQPRLSRACRSSLRLPARRRRA